MNFTKIMFFVFACFMVFATVSAAPGNFFKDLEGIGQRVRDAIESAGPAVDVVAQAVSLSRGNPQPQN